MTRLSIVVVADSKQASDVKQRSNRAAALGDYLVDMAEPLAQLRATASGFGCLVSRQALLFGRFGTVGLAIR
jgi:hypothetical protein